MWPYALDLVRGLERVLVAPLRSTLTWIESQFGRARREVMIPFGRTPSVFANRAKEPLILTSGGYGDGRSNVGMMTRVAARVSWPVFFIGDAPIKYREAGTSLANSHFLGSMPEADASAVIARAGAFTAEKMAGGYVAVYIDLALNAVDSGCDFRRAAPLDRLA